MEQIFDIPLVLTSVTRTVHNRGDTEDFKSRIKQEAEMRSINEFLYVIRRLHKLADIKPITDICLFKGEIQPMWEDPCNINGGKWIIKVKKGTAAQRLFERLILRMAIGPFATMAVNGVVVSIRGHQKILSIWTRDCPDKNTRLAQETEIKNILGLKTTITVSFKGNDESLKDKSSFRSIPPYPTPAAPTK
ncbi:translation initiation factor 4E [Nematocida displodere]|uniref:Translation initiation factor 4E n=1 Tax=Nematocida displodere TaxID=1805483 RepID=A0A177EKA8_9MICR|nr:translation initiation factor 4E [Nematocida displodere]